MEATPLSPSLVTRFVSEWVERDRAAAWIPDDRRALEQAAPLRELIAELLIAAARSGVAARDLYHACIRFGGELGANGASPTLAGSALDGAREALSAQSLKLGEPTWRALRAALLEGYVRALREQSDRAGLAAWEPPRCIVAVDATTATAAVAAGHPSTEADVLLPWAGRVAGALMVRGFRRAHVGGARDDSPAAAAVRDALTEAGIEVLPPVPARPR